MNEQQLTEQLAALFEDLKSATWKERDEAREALIAFLQSEAAPKAWLEFLDKERKTLSLELRWEIDEILEALKEPEPEEPEEEPEAEEEQEEDDPNRPLDPSDLKLVYDDPRGLMLHTSKKGDRWFATQVNPTTQQPQTFELQAAEVEKLKASLQGSPYWALGSGASLLT
jgi:hypothetical protein